MKINNWEFKFWNQILKEQKELNLKNEQQLLKAYIFKKKYLLTNENDLFLTLHSLIELNNIILNKNNHDLRKCQVKPTGYNLEYMHFKKIKFRLQI